MALGLFFCLPVLLVFPLSVSFYQMLHTHLFIYHPHYIILARYFIYQRIHNRVALNRILKFTLKQLLHVSVQSPSSGSVLFELAKVIVIKIIS